MAPRRSQSCYGEAMYRNSTKTRRDGTRAKILVTENRHSNSGYEWTFNQTLKSSITLWKCAGCTNIFTKQNNWRSVATLKVTPDDQLVTDPEHPARAHVCTPISKDLLQARFFFENTKEQVRRGVKLPRQAMDDFQQSLLSTYGTIPAEIAKEFGSFEYKKGSLNRVRTEALRAGLGEKAEKPKQVKLARPDQLRRTKPMQSSIVKSVRIVKNPSDRQFPTVGQLYSARKRKHLIFKRLDGPPLLRYDSVGHSQHLNDTYLDVVTNVHHSSIIYNEESSALIPRAVLITGCSRGIGLELVRQLAAANSTEFIFAACRNPETATELDAIAEVYPSVIPVECDVTNDLSIANAFQYVKSVLEPQQCGLNLLINNAGILQKQGNKFESLDRNRIMEHFNVNTVGPLMVTQAFFPLLNVSAEANQNPLSASKAAVITINTGAGSIGMNTSGSGVMGYGYRMSKVHGHVFPQASANMAMKALSIDKPNILCASVCPGWVRTDMGGSKASLSVQESVETLLKTILTLGPEHQGSFLNYDGKKYFW